MLVTLFTTNAQIWPREKSTDSSRDWRKGRLEEKQTHIGPRVKLIDGAQHGPISRKRDHPADYPWA
jgi:hypothetical protein